ncbi:ABC transporter ATP-binding protein [Streptomyces silvisoli]|uniref:ABC transporter ATP-binding protein n=1 Tax=Streptomyces silvisoli TaxID=3034235 RepID=A0ABT5ZTR8_9ACTN|nr:ABC transporter ATP-binding protein [Streptomyces silvisoli]MDF3293225.1 ABC transporter ATP-binding protein [Streptomyces silvisoli]
MSAGTAVPVLELVDVVREFPSDPPTRVLHGLNLTIDQGELVAVVGPSGSGKSTLLALLGTLDRPSSGTLAVTGHQVDRLSEAQLAVLRARDIGFVFQQFFLMPGLSAVENVATGLLYSGVEPAERRRRATNVLKTVGLGHRLHHKPNQLSGGEQQRVAIARAVVGSPRLLLADEPTGALDTHSGEEVVELLRTLNSRGTTVVVITHDAELAESFPRRIGIRDGRIAFDKRGPWL